MPEIIAKALLSRISPNERAAAIRDAIGDLSSGGGAEVETALALLEDYPDDEAMAILLERVSMIVRAGHCDEVIPALGRNIVFRDKLLQQVTEELAVEALRLRNAPEGHVVVSLYDTAQTDTTHTASRTDGLGLGFIEIRAQLRLLKRTLSMDYRLSPNTLGLLFRTILPYLGVVDNEACKDARDTLFSLFPRALISQSDVAWLWTCIEKLLAVNSVPFYHDLAYSVWFRWVASKGAAAQLLTSAQYWQLLRDGLQYGDGERRKQCLSILRASVAIAVHETTTQHLICSPDHSSTGVRIMTPDLRSALSDQYERYCVVYETILLGRYLNQIMECEGELSILASSQSAVKVEWLIILLASALAPQLQESVRKFVGGWIIRSNFLPDLSDGAVRFLRESFLPWATQGSLFTSTLGKRDGQMTCHHGERLVSYIALLLQHSAKNATTHVIIDILLDGLSRGQRGSFPYAAVYILEGLGHAFETTPALVLRPAHINILIELSSSPALPEVARDYMKVRCIKLCSDSSPRRPGTPEISRRWEDLLAVISNTGQISSSTAVEGAALSISQGMEANAMDQCERLRELLMTGNATPAQATSMLEDIWGDLEHLEYPKSLLIQLPALLLDVALVELALTSEELASNITDMTHVLQDFSESKAYLYSLLVCSIRRLILKYPEVDNVLPMAEFVAFFAEHLPRGTLDMQLEDATAVLLQNVAPALRTFDYNHYFGERESLGIAALLDMISRLSTNDSRIPRAVFNRLRQRWVGQKLPAPIVSFWKSTVQLQVMSLCCEQITPTLEAPALLQVLDDLEYVLSIEASPRHRFLLSWMIIRIYLKHPSARVRIIRALNTKDHHSNPKYVASLMKIAVIVARMEHSDAEFGLQLASALIPLAASSKVIIRHEAQWQFPSLMEHAREMSWLQVIDNTAFVALNEYVQSHERFGELHPERLFDRLDPVKDHHFTNLVEGAWFGLESVQTVSCTRADFIKLYDIDNKTFGNAGNVAPSCMLLGDPTMASVIETMARPEMMDPAAKVPAPPTSAEPRALQTKGTAYLASDSEDASDQRGRRRDDLIVVASLVENPYNLGGLSRCAEIFGATELHLQNRNVTSSKDFTNVSVSSHKHVPICQLSIPAVPAYLATQRDQGWTIVGIEQTDRSVLLGSAECQLPHKVVLVVGSEKEGIPALVLSECELLVEIPQQGVTRSLNVQTAAGIVLYEYARQHR